ncbi:L-ribulose-5-phosphate 4-epimerase [Neobacillus niacini]|uniref:L-ribulose-5-phosphate 4-epimerase n=1 Tax=Neobacillus niacini TaxID=86668 RepID=UPI0021CB5EBB|nr:L-ribulose-5-phosphate 4-epimerase [Neobacillus niacini]MCM3763633.1 L-ribulose-5-phosphate 4-epimerase [Neobacillus niacini]
METSFCKQYKKKILEANLALPKAGLVKLTWGNVSMIDRDEGIIVIKPSGVSYSTMSFDQMVVTDLDGRVLEGNLSPSSDLPTHLVLYKAFPEIGAVVHTHSKYAVEWAQSGRDIPPYGTTHADAFYGNIPCTRELTEEEVLKDYEVETGRVIVETFTSRGISPIAVPGAIVNGHGPFTWGKDVDAAVMNSIILEEVAEMALFSELLMKERKPIPNYLLDKHYYRKHGPNAYYGQRV